MALFGVGRRITITQIARLKDAEISNGNLINADDLDSEFNGLINESNAQDTRLTAIESGTLTIAGVKTFSSTPKMDAIAENSPGVGVTIDSVRLKDGMVKVAGTPAAAGEIGFVGSDLLFYNGSAAVALSTAIVGVTARSSNTILAAGDKGKIFSCSSSFTQTLTAAATLTSNWYCYIQNTSTGVVTIDPNSTETIDGLLTITLGPGNGCLLWCDGSNFFTTGRKPEVVIVQDQKSANTAGGTYTTGDWRTRDLNTEVIDTGNNCTISSNQFTLQPGTYEIECVMPAMYVTAGTTGTKARLQNITDASTTLLSNNTYGATSATNGPSHQVNLVGQFSITAAKAFEIQMSAGATYATNGFGFQANQGVTEIYTSVVLKKVI
jgi:hypothetical protein